MTKKIIICLSIVALIFVIGVIVNSGISVTEVILNGQLKGILKNKTIVHLSDLHIGSIGVKERNLIDRINKIKPDIIFLTGDYVKWDGDFEPAMKFLSELEAEIGIWAVMGDYDYSNSRKSCLFCHKDGSGERARLNQVEFLKNSGEFLGLNGERLYIFGIDAVEIFSDFLSQVLNKPENDEPVILLSHNPLNFDLLSNTKNILILAGDTHGGQIPLPSWFWGIIGYEKNEKYNYGLYEDGKKKMFVTRGIGTSHLPIRLFCSPEVVVFRF